jgi:hypothetical protein
MLKDWLPKLVLSLFMGISRRLRIFPNGRGRCVDLFSFHQQIWSMTEGKTMADSKGHSKNQTKTSGKAKQSAAVCKNGVCTVNWKPQRPSAA